MKSMETFDVESLDLSKGDTPRSTHVTITGIARTEYTVEFGTKSSGTTMLDRYIENPEAVVPGNNMKPYSGITSAEERAKIIAHLTAESDGQ